MAWHYMFKDLTTQFNAMLLQFGYLDSSFDSVVMSEDLQDFDLRILPDEYIVICDDNLKQLALEIFPANKILSLGVNIVPDLKIVEDLVASYGQSHLVAFGSGTINDICKYASFCSGSDYYLFPTAASMNGYLSNHASIKVDGVNKSFRAHLPKMIYVHLPIIKDAPRRLYYSGIGDLMCSVNTHLEWWLAHYYQKNNYHADLVALLFELEEVFLQGLQIDRLDLVKCTQLMELVLYSGLVMTVTGSSASASQSEHGFVHAFDLLYPEIASQYLHGEKVAYFTRYSMKIWKALISSGALFSDLDVALYRSLKRDTKALNLPIKLLKDMSDVIDMKIQTTLEIKNFAINKKISWLTLRSDVISALGNSRCYSRVKILSIVAAPLEQMSLSNLRIENAIKISPLIRDRFTIADLYMLASHKVANLV
jgi:glycerol dehydrogenase-like iron-containing ADH family enzyme